MGGRVVSVRDRRRPKTGVAAPRGPLGRDPAPPARRSGAANDASDVRRRDAGAVRPSAAPLARDDRGHRAAPGGDPGRRAPARSVRARAGARRPGSGAVPLDGRSPRPARPRHVRVRRPGLRRRPFSRAARATVLVGSHTLGACGPLARLLPRRLPERDAPGIPTQRVVLPGPHARAQDLHDLSQADGRPRAARASARRPGAGGTRGRGALGTDPMSAPPSTLSATDTAAALAAVLRAVHGAGAAVETWSAHPLSKRGKHRVVRYDVQARVAGDTEAHHYQWVGKFYERDEDARGVATTLRELAASGYGARGFVVPSVLAYDAPRRLLLLSHESGESVVKAIAAEGAHVLAVMGQALAALHAAPVTPATVTGPAAVLADLHGRIVELCSRFPAEAASLQRWCI